MNNKENYKKAIDQIHAKESLKEKTLEEMKKQKKNTFSYLKYLTGIAAVMILTCVGIVAYNYKPKDVLDKDYFKIDVGKIKSFDNVEGISRIKDMNQLKKLLESSNSYNNWETKGEIFDLDMATNTATTETAKEEYRGNKYSETNTQVEGVDEADIVKTDGEYIYYCNNQKIYIVNANTLEIFSTIQYDDKSNENFSPEEIFLNKDKLIVLGQFSKILQDDKYKRAESYELDIDYIYTSYEQYAIAKIYNISNRKLPKEERTILLDGSYSDSRMIGDNIYIISNKGTYNMKGEVLPVYKDTNMSDDYNSIKCTDIAYFENGDYGNYTIIGGFNITKDEPVNIETLLGAGNNRYVSESNLYIVRDNYKVNSSSKIYKFELNDAKVTLIADGEVRGTVNNQFSIDEYDGNLRIATTVVNQITPDTDTINGDIVTHTLGETEKTTRLTIFDENLNQIGLIENLAKDEEIKSVRFMGELGYVVTFEEIDPLFVIDLSNPRNPIIKGELKIPGYSSYLHMYDENHVIGIGYNTKSNGYGGVTNDNMKMSMFDVSDRNNPKEMFSIDIGKGYTYSPINYNHKVLFYNKEENLIGFPINNYSYRNDSNQFIIFKIDLEKGFEVYTDKLVSENFLEEIKRVIYIDDILYTMSSEEIVSYDLNSITEIKKLDLED